VGGFGLDFVEMFDGLAAGLDDGGDDAGLFGLADVVVGVADVDGPCGGEVEFLDQPSDAFGTRVAHLGGAQKRIQLRQCAIFYKADPDYGKRVAKGLGLNVKEVEKLAAMSQEDRVKATSA